MFTVVNHAEDGTYTDKFKSIDKALAYVEYQTGYTVKKYYNYIDRPFEGSDADFVIRNGGARIVDNYGRVFIINVL